MCRQFTFHALPFHSGPLLARLVECGCGPLSSSPPSMASPMLVAMGQGWETGDMPGAGGQCFKHPTASYDGAALDLDNSDDIAAYSMGSPPLLAYLAGGVRAGR